MLGNILLFFAGLICGLGVIFLWHGVRFFADLRAARQATGAHLFVDSPGERDQLALNAIEACKNRLRWHRNPNPEWLTPLVEEIPKLVKEIAAIYHPNSPQPLLAPGLSHFTHALQLAASDVTNFLQTRTVGRLMDVSAHTALRTWEKSRDVLQHETVQKIGKWYKRLLPVWQIVRFNSPIVWASMAVSNIATRTLQPSIVDIVARRAVELYSGRVAAGENPSSLARLEDVD